MTTSDSTLGGTLQACLPQKRNFREVFAAVVQSDQAAAVSEEIATCAADFVTWAPRTQLNHTQSFKNFVDFHALSKKWQNYCGKETSEEELKERVVTYLTDRLVSSQSRMDPTKKMSYDSLNSERIHILSVCFRFCPELRYNFTKRKQITEETIQHIKFLQQLYDLPVTKRAKFYLGVNEFTLMAEAVLAQKDLRSLDLAQQHIFFWALSLMTTVRPGSLVASPKYEDCYAKFKNATITRKPGSSKWEFIVDFEITTAKGHHTTEAYSQMYRLTPVREEHHLLLDAGLHCIVIGLRRDAFADYDNLYSLIEGNDSVLRWKPEFLERPIFAAGSKRGFGIEVDTPMHIKGAQTKFKEAVGLAGLDRKGFELRSIRRGAATVFAQTLGDSMAKSLMNHKQMSDTLNRHYSLAPSQVDLAAALLHGENVVVANMNKYDGAALYGRVMDGQRVVQELTLESALIASDELRVLHGQRNHLHRVLEAGIDFDVKTMQAHLLEPEREFIAKLNKNSRIHPAQLLHQQLSRRCIRVLTDMRSRHREYLRQKAFESAPPPTLATVEARLKSLQRPVDVVGMLRQLILEDQSCGDAEGGGRIEVRPLQPEDDGNEDDVQQDASGEQRDHSSNTPEPVERSAKLDAAREQLMLALVEHTDHFRGAQPCPICIKENPDDPAPHEWKGWFQVCRHMQSMHKDHDLEPYLKRQSKVAAPYATHKRVRLALDSQATAAHSIRSAGASPEITASTSGQPVNALAGPSAPGRSQAPTRGTGLGATINRFF